MSPPNQPPTDQPATPDAIVALAADHGLEIDAASVRINEAGLDFRVAFARGTDRRDPTRPREWVLRLPRRADVAAKLAEERRILEFIGPRLSVAVPRWELVSERLVAYRRLPGEPGLTLDARGEPQWRFDPVSPEFAGALGRLIAELHGLDRDAAAAAGVPTRSPEEVRAQWRADLAAVLAEFTVAPDLRARWEAWLADDRLWPASTVCTHGELYAAHVLIETPSQIVGVLDWTTAKVGDPAIDFVYQHRMGPAALDATVAAYVAAGGAAHPHLAARCAELMAAGPLVYGLFALATRDPQHRATAAAQLNPPRGDSVIEISL